MEPPGVGSGPPKDLNEVHLTGVPEPSEDPAMEPLNDFTVLEKSIEADTPQVNIESPTTPPITEPLDQPNHDPTDLPLVRPKEILVKPKREIIPARRIPKYLPDVDGNQWKVWPYPDVVELSTEYEEEVPELPEGVKVVGYGVDPATFRHEMIGPRWYHTITRWMGGILQFFNIIAFIKSAVQLWKDYLNKKKVEEDPETSDED